MMCDVSVRTFCAHIALLLFAACLVICSVLGTVMLSVDLDFAETAARTDAVLTWLSCLLIVAISAFSVYTVYRRRKL